MWWRALLVIIASWIFCSGASAQDKLLGELAAAFNAENLASSSMTVMSEAKEAFPKAAGSVAGPVATVYGMTRDLSAGKPAKEVQARAGGQELGALGAGRILAGPLVELGCAAGPWGCAGGIVAGVGIVAYSSYKAGQAAVAIQNNADQKQKQEAMQRAALEPVRPASSSAASPSATDNSRSKAPSAVAPNSNGTAPAWAGLGGASNSGTAARDNQAGGVRMGGTSAVQQDGSRRIGGLSDAAGVSGSGPSGSGGVRIGSTSANQPDGSRRIGGSGTVPAWSDLGPNSGGVRMGSTSAEQPDGSRRIGGDSQPPPADKNTSRDAPCIDYYSVGPSQCKGGAGEKKTDGLASGGDFAGNWRDAETSCSNPIRISPSGISGPGFAGFVNGYCSRGAIRPVQYPNAWTAQLSCAGNAPIAMEYRLSQLDADHLRLNVCTLGSCTNSQLSRCP